MKTEKIPLSCVLELLGIIPSLGWNCSVTLIPVLAIVFRGRASRLLPWIMKSIEVNRRESK